MDPGAGHQQEVVETTTAPDGGCRLGPPPGVPTPVSANVIPVPSMWTAVTPAQALLRKPVVQSVSQGWG
jgi:hypothetical protein